MKINMRMKTRSYNDRIRATHGAIIPTVDEIRSGCRLRANSETGFLREVPSCSCVTT